MKAVGLIFRHAANLRLPKFHLASVRVVQMVAWDRVHVLVDTDDELLALDQLWMSREGSEDIITFQRLAPENLVLLVAVFAECLVGDWLPILPVALVRLHDGRAPALFVTQRNDHTVTLELLLNLTERVI